MPTPRKGESKDKFVSRCIRQVRKEGKKQEQAVAQCLNTWRRRATKGTKKRRRK